jgi:hypothetical protein
MNNRSLTVIMVSTLLLLLPVACINAPSTTPTFPTLTYKNSAYGITIQYPQDWITHELGDGVVFGRPPSPSDPLPLTYGIEVQDISAQPKTLDEFTQEVKQEIGQHFPGYQIIDSTPTTLSGYAAQKMVCTMTLGRLVLKGLYVYTIANNKTYLVMYNSEMSRYSDFLEIVQQVTDSLEITSSTGQ